MPLWPGDAGEFDAFVGQFLGLLVGGLAVDVAALDLVNAAAGADKTLIDEVRVFDEFTGGALYNITFVVAMNKAKYDSLPDDLKAVIDANSGAEFSAMGGRIMEEADAPARKLAEDRGNNIVTLDEEQTAAWREAAQPVYAEWIAEMEKVGIDGQARIDQARALMEKYSQ